jgi:hypothetical protein
VQLLNDAFAALRERALEFAAVTVGPVDQLDPGVPRTTVSENDEPAQIRAMFGCGVVTSTKTEAASDYQVVRALAAGCRPVLPDGGSYPEILPQPLHKPCLYDISPESLADKLAEAMTPMNPPWRYEGFPQAFRAFDAISACRAIDERVEQLVGLYAKKG